MGINLLFVCTGNTCRSPLAEGMMRLMADAAGLQVNIRSAGVAASDGASISRHSEAILRDKGFRGTIASSRVTGALAEWADLILTMTEGHKRTLIRQYPQAIDKTHTLKAYVEDDAERLAADEERERLTVELEIKRALDQPISAEERARILELNRQSSNPDIADPFGGDRGDYEACADELETYLRKLVAKLKNAERKPGESS